MYKILFILFVILGILALITLYACIKISSEISRMEELEGDEIDE